MPSSQAAGGECRGPGSPAHVGNGAPDGARRRRWRGAVAAVATGAAAALLAASAVAAVQRAELVVGRAGGRQQRLQALWNAAADDDLVVGDRGLRWAGDRGNFEPRKWLESQRDAAEMRETAPLPTPGARRVFREDADHARNYQGAYVADNAIGVQVDALRAPTQMLRARTQGPAVSPHLEQLALLGAAGDPSSIAGWVGSAATRAELEYQMASSPVGWLGRDERTASQLMQTEKTQARRFVDALPDKLLKGPTAIQVIGRALNAH